MECQIMAIGSWLCGPQVASGCSRRLRVCLRRAHVGTATRPKPRPDVCHTGGMRASAAFTITELLVVMSIISVLVGVLLAGVQKARDAANRAKCLSNIKQI